MAKTYSVTVTVPEPPPVAEKYERVHFVAHCYFQFVDQKALEDQVRTKIAEIERTVGYRCFFRGTKIKGLEPLWLDVDFIWDLPATSPVATIVIEAIIILLVALGVIAIICWTIYIEEVKLFICHQCKDAEGNYLQFYGRADYDAHLQMEHPEKWSYIEEQREEAYWWLKLIPKWLPTALGITIVAATVAIVLPPILRLIPKPKRD